MNHYSKKESKTSLFSLGKEEATSSNLVIGSTFNHQILLNAY